MRVFSSRLTSPGPIRLGAWGILLIVGMLVGSTACQSLDAPPPRIEGPVSVLWSGGVTSTRAVVTARVDPGMASDVRLRVYATDTPTRNRIVDATDKPTSDVYRFDLRDLQPQTTYRYEVRLDGVADTSRSGTFATFADGPFSFRIAMGGCAETGSNHRVFDVIRMTEPDLFLHPGDMHYEDIDSEDATDYREAFQHVHASPRQSRLYRSTPIAYVWDDHDFGPNNSSRRAPGREMAQRVYREYVPHYPMAAGDGARPIHHAFTVGRVRVIMSDLRSARTFNQRPDTEDKTMMGDIQKAWFKDELRAARDRYPVIVWVSSVPWIGDDPDALDRWSGFSTEREELARFIDSIGVQDQLVLVSGDAHMTALDDGTNNRYGLSDGGGFPVVQAAALDRRGSVKGGPYTHGPYPNRVSLFGTDKDGQFVLMDVQDDGGAEVCVTWTGKRYRYDTKDVETLLSWSKCFPAVADRSR